MSFVAQIPSQQCLRTNALMQAIVYSGSVLKLEELEKPVPADEEVLVKVRAASVSPLDHHFLRHPFMRPISAKHRVLEEKARRSQLKRLRAKPSTDE